jgi:hypothetical protein
LKHLILRSERRADLEALAYSRQEVAADLVPGRHGCHRLGPDLLVELLSSDAHGAGAYDIGTSAAPSAEPSTGDTRSNRWSRTRKLAPMIHERHRVVGPREMQRTSFLRLDARGSKYDADAMSIVAASPSEGGWTGPKACFLPRLNVLAAETAVGRLAAPCISFNDAQHRAQTMRPASPRMQQGGLRSWKMGHPRQSSSAAIAQQLWPSLMDKKGPRSRG